MTVLDILVLVVGVLSIGCGVSALVCRLPLVSRIRARYVRNRIEDRGQPGLVVADGAWIPGARMIATIAVAIVVVGMAFVLVAVLGVV